MNAPGMGKRSVWMKLAAAVASGLLVAGLFPPFHMSSMAWVAMIPLLAALWSIDGKNPGRRGFLLGWFAGTLSCMIQFNWLSEVSWLGALLLPMYLGCYWGLFGLFASTIGNPWRACEDSPQGSWAVCRKSLRVAFCHGAVWAGLEWLRGWLFTGFGWNGLGVAFHETPVIAQAADLLGVTGLSLLLVFFQAVMVQVGQRLIRRTENGSRRMWMDLAITTSVVGLVVCYGNARISLENQRESTRLKTLLVQINIPQNAAQVLWSALDVHMAYENETLAGLKTLADKDMPDWVMWPECALTGRILNTDTGVWGAGLENQETISRVREAGPFQLLYGITEMEAEQVGENQLVPKPKGRIWNSLAVMTPQDDLQTYRKHHLVIFGETIPFVDSIPLLKKIYEQQAGIEYGGSFTPGESFEPLPVPTAAGTRIGAIPSICFEDSVPRLTRKFVRPGPQVIVNVTNDGWFGQSPAAAQHFAYARFRAIELRRPMLRCANTGVSAAIDTTGSTAHPDTGKPQVLVNADGSHFTRGSLLTELNVPLHPSFSLYAVIGDWGITGIALLGFAWAWWKARSEKRGMPA